MKRNYVALLLIIAVLCGPSVFAFDGFIGLRDGYFYDKATGEAWVPHGIAYQNWNRPLGVWQTFEQIDYDLDEIVKMGANSVRIDMVWQHIEEDGPGIFNWDNYDYFIQACEERGLRIFALIGYQWPPNWFPDEWYTQHPPEWDAEGIYHPERWQSDIINYEHPGARAAYSNWISAVCERYENEKAVVAWIVGNEYGYLGLWSGLLDGYDPETEQAFRDWCQTKYGTIAAANAIWGSSFASFDDIEFVEQYRAYGVEGAIWADMVQFREDSIADFTALSAVAARSGNTNHLVSYSTVGMQWGEEDWRYHAEDRGKITEYAAAAGAPIDFFSVNNYPWSVLGHESQQGHWGISYTKKTAGVPVLYTETGFTSSETMWPGMNEFRQGPLIRNSLWESLQAGAIGTHIFSWMDRPYITDREKGFGIVYADRRVKPALWTSKEAFNLMTQVDIHNLLMGSEDPTPDIAFLWTDANDSQYNRYECEMQQIAGALERLGYEPYFIDLQDLAAGAYHDYEAIILPRNMRVEDTVPGYTNSILNFLLTHVIPAGVHVMATADLPGIQDFHGRPRAESLDELDALFGIDASDIGGYEAPMRRREYVSWYWKLIEVDFNTNSPIDDYHCWPQVWKYSDEVKLTDGTLWATMDSGRNKGFEDSDTEVVKWGGTWGDVHVRSGWGWAFDGNNMVQMWGDSGMWDDFEVVPFGRYTASVRLRSTQDDPLRGGAYASVALEWYDKEENLLGVSESDRLTGVSYGWGRIMQQRQDYFVDAIAPADAWMARRVIRVGTDVCPNLLHNPGLNPSWQYGTPEGWTPWDGHTHDPETNVYRSAPNSWAFWSYGGIFQYIQANENSLRDFVAGDTLDFGGYLYNPSWDPLRNGTKYGAIEIEFYNGTNLLLRSTASPTVNSSSPQDTWIYSHGSVVVPANVTKAQVTVRGYDHTSGDGRFLADDIALTNMSPGGSVFVDHEQRSPAVVVKDHGPAKAGIFLFSAGDQKPDGDLDGDPDVYAWKWRYDYFGAMVKDYFGVEPQVEVSGDNAYLCLAEHRTLADGATLWQVKNYMYDTNFPASWTNLGGGVEQTFTISSPLFEGKTIQALYQSRILKEKSDGTINLTLDPDGMEMLLVYDSIADNDDASGSSDGQMWGMNNAHTFATDEGPQAFPLSNVYTAFYSYARTPVVAGDRIYAVVNYFAHMIGCWDAKTGSNLWTFTSPGGTPDSFSSRSIAVADGILYISTKNNSNTNYPPGTLWALSAKTGEFLWKFENQTGQGSGYSASPPVVEDGIVYAAFKNDRLRAFYADTGVMKWETTNVAGAADYAGISFADGKIYNIVGGVLSAYDTETGARLWTVNVGRPSYAESTPVVADGRVYVARNHMATGVGVYNATNGALLWNYPGISLNKFAATAVRGNRMYMVGQATNEIGVTKLFAFDSTQAGAPLWSYTLPETSYLDITPILANDALYMNANTNLLVVNATSGTLLQTLPHNGAYGEPFVKNGWVFVPHGSGRIQALSDGSPWPASGVADDMTAGYWKMDEARWTGAAGEVLDSSGLDNHGRAFNGPTTVWGGRVLKAGSFDGVNDYVEIPNNANLQVAGDMTLSFWIRPENLGSARINPLDKSYGGEFALTIETSRGMSYYHGTARAGGKYWGWSAFTNGTLKNGEWQHIAITRDATARQMKSYLNGRLMRTATYSSNTNTLPAASTYPVRIAQGYTGARMKGLVDEVKIAAKVMNEAQVTAEAANRATLQLVRFKDYPAVVKPMGDKLYPVRIGFDCRGREDLSLRLAFMEIGDNGDGVPDEMYQLLDDSVDGAGEHTFWVWIPDYDQNDPDYISTPDGGRYQFAAWLEDESGIRVASALPVETRLEWGVRPTATLPTSLNKGDQVEIPIEWENLYEYLPWETTPLTRNDAFPNRLALFRSLKTEAQFPGHLDRVNQVADWLESMGYESGNRLDTAFDNVLVLQGDGDGDGEVVFSDDMESGTNGWTASGLWHIAGDRYSSPVKSWAYNDGVDYDTGMANSGALISEWIDLTDSGMAVLRFRSWYQTEGGTYYDKKLVQVSTDGANWTQILQVSGAMTTWTDESVDLSAYAGQMVKIRFYFDTVDSIANAYPGWYVDDVEVETQTDPLLLSDSFSGPGMPNWSRGAGSANWEIDNQSVPVTFGNDMELDGGYGWMIDTNRSASFKITADQDNVVDAIDVFIYNYYRVPITMRVYEDNGGVPGTTVMSATTLTPGSTYYGWMTFNLPDFAVTEGQAYHYVFTVEADTNSYGYVYYTAPASSGRDVLYRYGTGSWVSQGQEPAFRIVYADDQEQVQPYRAAYRYTIYNGYRHGQRFTAENEMAVNSIKVYLSAYYSPNGPVTLRLRRWSDYAVLGSATVSQGTVPVYPNPGWVQFDMPPGVELEAGADYFFELDHEGSSGYYYIYVGYGHGMSQYSYEGTNSGFVYSSNDGSSWYYYDYMDAQFIVEGDEGESTLRASRIGNSDNIIVAGDGSWSNYIVSADIRYNKQGPYFNDAELFVRYVDRDNFVKVGIRNFHGFWRLKYTVRENTNIVDQGWIHEFSKADRPVEGEWYNLKVKAEGNTYTVYFDGEEVGEFTTGIFLSGKIGLGTMAAQLGIWEPQKGYYFVDDDEYSFWAPEGQAQQSGRPLNLDWGYLDAFFPTLILPSTYVMSDIEVSNVETWLSDGLRTLIAMDGGIAMRDETGAVRMGRIEPLFGVDSSVTAISGLNRVTIGEEDHYITLDYNPGAEIIAEGAAMAWTTPTTGVGLGTLGNGIASAPALIAHKIDDDPDSPKKVFVFNFGVDMLEQLTGEFSQVAKRAFEWCQGEAYRVTLELKYPSPLGDPGLDITILRVQGWILTGSGQSTLVVNLPNGGIMTGDDMYWVLYVHPWDSGDPWTDHAGFYTSANDTDSMPVSIAGKGLQILGVSGVAYGGREWDTWVAYNTRGESLDLTFGLKKKGSLLDESAFTNAGNYAGWTIVPHSNIFWSGTANDTLRADVVGTGGYSYITRDGLDVADRNITMEYDVYFSPQATNGGIVYRGKVLYLNPAMAGWDDADPQFFTETGLTVGSWHRVVLSIRDGDPYLMSDLYVDGQPVFLSEPIEMTNWTSTTMGMLSPYYGGYCEWDNVRFSDEQYSFVTIPASGIYVPTNEAVASYYSWVPDFDPDWWEFESTALGGQYEWYAYFRGEGEHAYSNASVYFAPRLMVESPSFPVEINAGDVVQVPVEWEGLGTNLPAKLAVALQHVGSRAKYGETEVLITQGSGSALITVNVSAEALDGEYMWAAYMYPTNAIDPFLERLGFDDTYRSDADGMPIEPETEIIVHGSNGVFTAYSDAGLALGSELYKWPSGAYVDANFTLFPAPEGVESCYALRTTGYIGWGLFKTVGTYDMSAFNGGYLKFWLWSMETLKVEVEGPRWIKGSLNIPSTGGVWQEITIPLSSYGAVDLSRIYGLFMITSYDGAEYLVDHVRWIQP